MRQGGMRAHFSFLLNMHTHGCFEDLIFPTRNFKNFKFCQISVSICVKLFPEPGYDFHSCYYLVAPGTGG